MNTRIDGKAVGMHERQLAHLKKQTKRLALWFGVALGILTGLVVVAGAALRPTIRVEPTPAGAVVTINGTTYPPAAPVRVFPFLPSTVRVETPGFFPYSKRLRPTLGQTTLLKPTLELFPAPTKLSSAARGTSINPDTGSIFFFDLGSGEFERVRIGTSTVTERISPSNLPIPQSVAWNPAHDLAILERDGQAFFYDFRRYDLLHQEEIRLRDDLREPVWSPSGARAAAILANLDEQKLVRANPTFSEMDRLTELDDDPNTTALHWSPDGSVIAVAASGRVRLFSLESYAWIELEGMRGPLVRFSPNGLLVLGNDQAGNLVLYNRKGASTKLVAASYPVSRAIFTDNEHVLLAAENRWLERNLTTGKTETLPVRGVGPETDMMLVGVSERPTLGQRFLVFLNGMALYVTRLQGTPDAR